MGGACSLKRDAHDDDNIIRRGFSSRRFKIGRSSCLESFLLGRGVDGPLGRNNCPSLMKLCVHSIRKDLDKYNSFSMLPRDISQLIFNNLVYSNGLSDDSIEAFRDCALHDMWMGEYNGVKDNWMDVFSSQGSSLLSVYIFGSKVTDFGFSLLRNCPNLQVLSFDCCDRISEQRIKQVSAMEALLSLDKLVKLDFKRCPQIHGGFVHLQGLPKLESLSVRCCQCIMDSDMQPLAGIASLKELQIVCLYITDYGVSYLRGLNKLVVLNMEGSHVTTSCLDTISGLTKLQGLDFDSCRITDDGLAHLSGLAKLEDLNLKFTLVTDDGLKMLSGLTCLKSLNLDVRQITDSGLAFLTDFRNLQSLDLCGGTLTDAGVENIKDLSSMIFLNLSQNRNLTDKTLELLSGLKLLVYLNVSNSCITNDGLKYLKPLKNLHTLDLEYCNVTPSEIKKLQDNVLLNLVRYRPN
ncbi:hypothetical protein H5410_059245 [Solanum commersonii]|uniref:F-box/LRR-repeat protein 15-like leucin rich repeat domain-containing protein n=1 Tax=Solanum commersonii TaxID=4109 RepID=A0A9J5W280_SOLCO|nr:hypothetical protein H5410_059245 [Solanum commersonii]